jgi:uncharacterized protein (DUF169 family)
MMDTKSLGEALEKYLRVETFPLGILSVRDPKKIPDKAREPVKHMHARLAICQGISIARKYGWTMAMGKDDVSCPIAKAVFGFEEKLPYYEEGKLAVGMYTEEEESGRRMEEALEKYDFGEFSHVVFGPLSRIHYDPDTVLVYGNSAQILRLVNAALFKEGGSIVSDYSGRGDCSDIIIKGRKRKKPQVILPCYGDRIFGMTADHEMAFTFPFPVSDEIVEGLEKTHKMGVRYPIPQYLRFEATYPPSYQELEKMWDEKGKSS